MKPATHSGTCQACGSLQKLPGGALAKHGYTTKWGFFSGTCRGSDHSPFEIDCDLVKESIADAQTQVKVYEGQQMALRAPQQPVGSVWAHVYVEHLTQTSYGWKGGYKWVAGALTQVGYKFTVTMNDTPYEVTAVPFDVQDLQAAADHLNGTRADFYQGKAMQLKDYIAFQNKRLVGWKQDESKLIPVAKASDTPRIVVGQRVCVHGVERTVVRIGYATCRGVGPSLNGQHLEHAFFEGSNGKELCVPLRTIRTPKAVTA